MKDITDTVNDVCTDCCGLQLRPRWTCPIRLVTVCTRHYYHVRATACPVQIRAHHHVVLLHCGCLSLIPFNPFNEFMNLEFGTTHQVQMC